MSNLWSNNGYITNRRKIAYTYNVTTPAAILPINLDEVKVFLKLDTTDSSEDELLTMLMQLAVEVGEKYTKRDFINKTYTTFRDNFYEPFEIRCSKVSSIASMSYLVDNVFTTIPTSVYAVENSNDYPYIYLKTDQSWPVDGDDLPQSIKIIFVSGYGATAASVPAALKIALLQHITVLYNNRGDCGGDCSGTNASSLPGNLRSLYNQFRIISIGSYERPAVHLGY